MATALTLTPDEKERYIEIVRRRAQAVAPPLQQDERERLLVKAHEAAAQLKLRFGARRILLFGSLAHGAWFAPDSDIDLAVEGLDGPSYWQAWSLAEQILGDRQVDLVDVTEVSPSLRRVIEDDGISL
jgi:predicted nucleotidyltransferase